MNNGLFDDYWLSPNPDETKARTLRDLIEAIAFERKLDQLLASCHITRSSNE